MISPNFVYFLGLIIVFVVFTKSIITASTWLAIPTAWYFTLDMDIRVAFLALIIAGVFSQLVVLFKSENDEFKFSKRIS